MTFDPYRHAASLLFNVPQEQVTPEQRLKAKNYVLMRGFGGYDRTVIEGDYKVVDDPIKTP